MKRYIFGRLVRAIVSIFAVTCIAILLVYTMIPKDIVFKNDQATFQKLASKPDAIAEYKYSRWEQLGYLDYVTQAEMCSAEGIDYNACMALKEEEYTTSTGKTVKKYSSSDVAEKVIQSYIDKGYEVQKLTNGLAYASKDYSGFQIITKFFTNLIKFDNPQQINDQNNPDLQRGIYLGKDYKGLPAIMCSGCEHNYLLYLDGKFPFIHQNWLRLNFGISYPTYPGLNTLDVINDGQGEIVKTKQTFSNGYQTDSAYDLHTCTYKQSSALDHLDKQRFDDNYANCKNVYQDPSMVGTSYLLGVISIILAYAIAVPVGMYMAQKKDKLPDKIGIIYINIMISLPSLAFIYFLKMIGFRLGLPDKFPLLGYGDLRSYILPILILALLSTASIMIWIRRYMVDQMNADYVKFARAKGLSQGEIFRRHILRNAIIPIVNGIPGSIILAISGSVITETVFAISGMGKMLPDSIKMNNNNMVVTLTFIFTALSILSLLLGDIVMTWVDPRIQLTTKGGSK